MKPISRKTRLLSELAIFMIGVPLLLWLALPPSAILPTVWGMAIFCHYLSQQIPRQKFRDWWNAKALTRENLIPMLRRFAICAVLLLAVTYALKPQVLFNFVMEKPLFWLVVMIMYPLISVVPQEIIFRRYIFARYEGLMQPLTLLLVSGIGFGFAHIVFDNWVAPTLCAIGGVMFARTYQKTRSIALVSLEHALYGDLVFTLGLGRYFYHGAVGQ